MSGSYDRDTIERLINDKLTWSEIKRIMSRYKDSDRFQTYRSLLQERVGWSERILLPISERLYVVQNDDQSRSIKCECGHKICDADQNWRLHVLIYVRDSTAALEEVYPGAKAPDPEFMQLREFYCPSCATQLEVDAMTPGYPVLNEFEPDIDTFYREWLSEELPLGEGRVK